MHDYNLVCSSSHQPHRQFMSIQNQYHASLCKSCTLYRVRCANPPISLRLVTLFTLYSNILGNRWVLNIILLFTLHSEIFKVSAWATRGQLLSSSFLVIGNLFDASLWSTIKVCTKWLIDIQPWYPQPWLSVSYDMICISLQTICLKIKTCIRRDILYRVMHVFNLEYICSTF